MLRAPIPKIIRMFMGWDTAVPLIFGIVAFASFFVVPNFIFLMLTTPIITYLAEHWFWGFCIFISLASSMIWYAIQVSARMQIWIDSTDDIDGWANLLVAMPAIVFYKIITDDVTQRTRSLDLKGEAATNVQFAVEAWMVLWFILVTYIGKAPWDRVRGQAVKRVANAR